MTSIELQSPIRPEIRIVGNEKTPVVVIDEPIVTTEALVRHACQRITFDPVVQSAYPGVRANLPSAYVDALLPELTALIHEVYDIPATYQHNLVHRFFSLITKKPAELAPLQRVPHFDARRPYYFATVHYLNAGDFGGTGVFRHRPTGYERVSIDRFQSYVQAAESHMKAHGLPAARYINASDDHYELIAELDYRPNRLLVYPGNLLHSSLTQPDTDINSDPATGRLTANLFVDFAESPPC